MRYLTWTEIQAEPDTTVFAAVSSAGDEGCLRIKIPDADDWVDEYASWTFKVYDEQDRRDMAELLLDPAKAMAAIRASREGDGA